MKRPCSLASSALALPSLGSSSLGSSSLVLCLLDVHLPHTRPPLLLLRLALTLLATLLVFVLVRRVLRVGGTKAVLVSASAPGNAAVKTLAESFPITLNGPRAPPMREWHVSAARAAWASMCRPAGPKPRWRLRVRLFSLVLAPLLFVFPSFPPFASFPRFRFDLPLGIAARFLWSFDCATLSLPRPLPPAVLVFSILGCYLSWIKDANERTLPAICESETPVSMANMIMGWHVRPFLPSCLASLFSPFFLFLLSSLVSVHPRPLRFPRHCALSSEKSAHWASSGASSGRAHAAPPALPPLPDARRPHAPSASGQVASGERGRVGTSPMPNNVTIRSPSRPLPPTLASASPIPRSRYAPMRIAVHHIPRPSPLLVPTSLSPPRSHPLILLLAPLGVPSTDLFVSQTYRAPSGAPGAHRPHPRLDRTPSPESEQEGGHARSASVCGYRAPGRRVDLGVNHPTFAATYLLSPIFRIILFGNPVSSGNPSAIKGAIWKPGFHRNPNTLGIGRYLGRSNQLMLPRFSIGA
ncbi:hypothetical protein C8R45DRAFT_1104704 [Mycena sanguinolenta]|nr:hypothetical protein C8R45DRAFT_1104704 [Mycena sanguinolenta]